jgi:hypothetical protein
VREGFVSFFTCILGLEITLPSAHPLSPSGGSVRIPLLEVNIYGVFAWAQSHICQPALVEFPS